MSNSHIQDNECGVLGVQGQPDYSEIVSKKPKREPGGGCAHPSTQEVEARGSLSSRPALNNNNLKSIRKKEL